jgi:hypothetical protein
MLKCAAIIASGIMMLAAGPAAAAPIVRALIVGINTYSDPTVTLHGAVNDAQAIRDRLALKPFNLPLVAFPTGSCEAANDHSHILIESCATRAKILGTFDDLAAHSKPGDILLFYFAGHGSQTPALGIARIKALEQTSTIVAADSRSKTANGVVDDIAGTTLRKHIEAAEAAGINIVTIFDSCNSGSASRNLDTSLTRWIPPLPAHAAPDDPDPPHLFAAWTPGREIHLAAAADGTLALERDGHGRFTQALIAAISEHPDATYGDILHAIRTLIAQTPADQIPKGEGDLATTSFLGRPGDRDARIFTASAAGQQMSFQGDGLLSGVTVGSTYALYDSEADALAGKNQRGVAQVTAALAQSATLAVQGAVQLQPTVIAREITHSFGSLVLSVGFRGITDAEIAALKLQDLPLIKRDDVNPDVIVVRDQGALLLLTATRSKIATIDRIEAPSDVEKIGVALRRVANANALLALPQKAGQPMATLSFVGRCPAGCSVAAPIDQTAPHLTKGDKFRLAVTNAAGATIYPYLFAISPQYGISRLYPPGGASDALPADQAFYVGETVTAAAPGVTKLVLILSSLPIPAGPLEQGGLPRGSCDSGSALTMLLCAAASGTRAGDVVPLGDFDVIKTVVTIDEGETK